MSSKSAKVIIFVVVAIVAICLAGVFAAMTGTIYLNFGDDDNSTVNNTTTHNNTQTVQHSQHSSSSSYSNYRQSETPEQPDPSQNTTTG